MARVLPFPQEPQQEIIQEAASCIQQGGVLALATESYYALAAGVEQVSAIQRVVIMKGDRKAKPILLLIADKMQLLKLISRLPPEANALINRFWPGPLTLVLPAASPLSALLTGGTGTIGVRQPQHLPLLSLLRTTGPLTGTSANRSGQPPLQDPTEVEKVFGQELDLILDSGLSPGGSSSTVLSLVGKVRLLREGPVSSQEIQAVLSAEGLALSCSTE